MKKGYVAPLHLEKPKFNTLLTRNNSAAICRKNGWGVGTTISGVENGVRDTITISAIGYTTILAYHPQGGERIWNLKYREWKKVIKPKG